MAPSFPLAPVPAWFASVTTNKPRGVIYDPSSGAVTVNLSKAGATAWRVLNYYGTQVASGTLGGTETTFNIPAPAGGWVYGYYRVYTTGPNTDSLFADSYGVTSFSVVPADARFPAITSAAGGTEPTGENVDVVAKGALGIGTTRISIGDPSSATQLTAALTLAALAKTWWLDTNSDPVRKRGLLVTFPNGGAAADITNCVSQLYAAGVEWFEGPSNEPPQNSQSAVASSFITFINAVKAGNANAKTVGPCFVDWLSASTYWPTFFSAMGATKPDAFSNHAYNWETSGDMNLGRSTLAACKAVLANAGWDSLPIWLTESTGAGFIPVYGVHHPRRARRLMMQILLAEEGGIAREFNVPWYDVSHGFWPNPSWFENGDGSLTPIAALMYTLGRETYGQTYQSHLTFPGVADNIIGGWLYAGTSAQTLVLMSTSALDSLDSAATVTISTNAAGPLSVIDAWGNSSTVPVTNGLATLPVSEVPSYVRLPVGATCSISSVFGWDNSVDTLTDAALNALVTVDGTPVTGPTSGGFITRYDLQTGIYTSSSAPSAIVVPWTTPARPKWLVLWGGSVYQNNGALVAFTVDVTYDGTTWHTVATVDESAVATSFACGTDASNVGCSRETFWPEQWVFPVKLTGVTGPVKSLRVNVSQTSYGGEPDAASIAAGGQGNSSQHIVLQRVAVLGRKAASLGALTLSR